MLRVGSALVAQHVDSEHLSRSQLCVFWQSEEVEATMKTACLLAVLAVAAHLAVPSSAIFTSLFDKLSQR